MKITSRLLLLGCCLLIVTITKAQTSIGGFNVYYGHLHNHSNVSDGTNTPDAAYNYAKNTGKLDFFSLADHSGAIDATEWTSMKAAADKYNQPDVFTAFCGFEWTENVLGHVAVINSQNYITTASPNNTFAGLCNWLNTNECVAFFNHPGRNNSTGREFDHFTATPSDKFVGMELWNKTDRFPVYYYTDGYYPNDGNKSWFDEAIDRGWKVGASGSEDNHSGTWGTATNSRLAVLASANNRTEIYNALKARRFFTTYDKNMGLSFQIDGNEMGSTISASTLPFIILASDGDGEVFTQVQLLKNGAVIQTWTPNTSAVSISGNMTFTNGEYYYIRVKQADSDEAITSPIWIGAINNSPSSSITSPLQNSMFISPASIVISASAIDTDGSIQKVEFYQGTTLIGESTTFPYSYTWTDVPLGSYQLTAKAIDDLGAYAVSAAIQISVNNPGDPVTTSSSIAMGMDDIEESSVGNLSNNVNSTDIELVDDASTTAAIQVVGLRFNSLNIPRGAVISNAYIQFTCDEISTNTCNLTISGEAVDNSSAFTTTAFNISNRTKTIAQVGWAPEAWNVVGEAGMKQQTPNLSTIIQEIVSRSGYLSTGAISLIITGTGTRIAESFEGSPTQVARLYITYTLEQGNQPPVVSITNPAEGTDYTTPASIDFTSTATDPDGTIVKVEYYNGISLIGMGEGSSSVFTWNDVPEGTYAITARATDDGGLVTESAPVHVVVSLPNQAPEVFIALPLEGTEFIAPAAITINVNATDADGSIANVDFYQGTNLIGSDNSSPFSFAWSNAPEGSYSFTAVATDDKGAIASSAIVSVLVNAAPVTQVFSTRIAMGSDDAEETAKGVVNTGGDDIELVYDSKATGSQIVGLRFNNVSIPKDALITKAYIQFIVDEKTNAGCNLTVRGEKNINPATFSTSFNVSGRSKTIAGINWVPAGWSTVGLAGATQQTPDLKSIVQEIVTQTAWISGNSVAFIITGTGNGKRTAVAYETSPAKTAMLYIEYQASPMLKAGRIGLATAENQVSIEPNSSDTELECYPIPFSDLLNVELKSADNDRIILIEVFNSNGALLKGINSYETKAQVQLPGLPSGIYFIRVKTFGKTFQRKVIKK